MFTRSRIFFLAARRCGRSGGTRDRQRFRCGQCWISVYGFGRRRSMVSHAPCSGGDWTNEKVVVIFPTRLAVHKSPLRPN